MAKKVEVSTEVKRMCMGCAMVRAGFTCATVKQEEQVVRATKDHACYDAKTFTPNGEALTHSARVRSVLGKWGWKNTYNAKL